MSKNDDFDFGFDQEDDFGFDESQSASDDFDFGEEPEEETKRREADFYPTEPEVVSKFLYAFDEHTGHLSRMKQDQSLVLDPCCGGLRTPNYKVYESGPYPTELLKFGFPSKYIFTNDIREDATGAFTQDFLKTRLPLPRRPNLIISNPPYSLAVEFVERALDLVVDDGWVMFLLRLNFLGAQKRHEFWKQPFHRPYGIFVHSKRPSFTGDGGTDSTEYAHFVWRKTNNVKSTMLEWLL